MGEKRQLKQQRRRRRKAQRSDRAAGPARRGVRDIAAGLDRIAEIAAGDAHAPADALEAEQLASALIGTMHERAMPGDDVEAILVPGLVAALERLSGAGALATLRALAAVTRPEHARFASAAADRLAAAGLPEPAWAGDLGQARAIAAVLIHEDAFDDGACVLVEFEAPGAAAHTLAVYIDHNLGGLPKDILLAGPLAALRADAEREAARTPGMAVRDLDLAEARARVASALDVLDHTWDPPVSEDVRYVRALVEARLRTLPDGFELPTELVEVTIEEREALLEDFLASREGRRWRGDDDAADVADLAIWFGCDYNHGGPLRWSPAVVEIFMTSWLARKVANEPEFFARVPDVLRDWVRYAARRRGVPAALRREAVATVDECRGPMLESVVDPAAWGPAKAFEVAALEAGVDLTDSDELDRFVQRYNEGLAA